MRSDNGGEFIYEPMKQFYGKHEILHQTYSIETRQQNGKVERKHSHILNVARALHFHANFPLDFWWERVLTAAYLINRTPSSIFHEKHLMKFYFMKNHQMITFEYLVACVMLIRF